MANVRFAGYQPRRTAGRGARHRRRPRRAAARRARRRQRPVQDVLEPCRRPPGGRLDRSRQRDPAAARGVGRRRGRGARRRRRRSWPRSRGLLDDPGAGGRRWVPPGAVVGRGGGVAGGRRQLVRALLYDAPAAAADAADRADSLAGSWQPLVDQERPPSWRKRARDARSASRAAPCSRPPWRSCWCSASRSIVYSRQSLPAADAAPPTIEDHWHAAYGFYLLRHLVPAARATSRRSTPTGSSPIPIPPHRRAQPRRRRHPLAPVHVGGGRRATPCSACSSTTTASSSPTTPSSSPTNQPARPPASDDEYIEGETQCNGEDAELSVEAWGSFTDTDAGKRTSPTWTDVHIDNDGMVFAIYFTPKDTDQPMPPWAPAAAGAGRRRHRTRIDRTTSSAGTTLPGSTTPDQRRAGRDSVADSTAPSSAAPTTTTG